MRSGYNDNTIRVAALLEELKRLSEIDLKTRVIVNKLFPFVDAGRPGSMAVSQERNTRGCSIGEATDLTWRKPTIQISKNGWKSVGLKLLNKEMIMKCFGLRKWDIHNPIVRGIIDGLILGIVLAVGIVIGILLAIYKMDVYSPVIVQPF